MFANFWIWMDEQVEAGIVIAPEEVLIELDAKGRSSQPRASESCLSKQALSRA
jgi:hypothetical protein